MTPSPLFRQGLCLLTIVACSALPSLATAHHSFALFDQTKMVTVQGVVERFAWTNPHITIYLDTPGPPPSASRSRQAVSMRCSAQAGTLIRSRLAKAPRCPSGR